MERVNTSSELLEAQAYIWNQVFNFINSMSLKCATELGIPNIIHKHDGPMTLSELVDALPGVDKSKADCVDRLMRVLTHSGFFLMENINSTDEKGYSLTHASRLLVGDRPGSMKPYVLSLLEPNLTEPWQHLSRWFQDNKDRKAFHAANAMSLWEYKERNSRYSRLFDQSLESDTPVVANVIARDCRQVFEGLDSLVAVGGGTGTLAKAIAEAFPQMHCTVLDLAPVVAGLEGTKNLKYVEGDMFKYIPPSDAVLLKLILHDWSDEESVEILKKCKEAIKSKGKKGKVIIIDMVIDDQERDHKSVETQLFFDMLMMILVGGKEKRKRMGKALF